MRKVTFDGGWLELREPNEVTNAGRRSIRAAMASVAGPMTTILRLVGEELDKLGLDDGQEPTEEQTAEAHGVATTKVDYSPEQWERMQRLNDVALVAVIHKWSLSEPVNVGTLDDLPADIVDKITAAGAVTAAKAIHGQDVDFEPTPEPAENPTGA